MADLNIMPWFTDAYLADTTHLKTIEHGAYDLLLLSMWRAGGSLPNEEPLLQRITKLTPSEWKKVWPVVSKFFTTEGGRITQKKLSSTYANVSARVEKNRANGRLGGRPAKSLANNDTHKPNGSVSVSQTQTEKEPNGTLTKTVSESKTNLDRQGASDDARPPTKADLKQAVETYNAIAQRSGWTQVKTLNATREAKLRKRLSECGGVEGWREQMERAGKSDYLLGLVKRSAGYENWMPDFDFYLQASSFTKLIEGKYDNNKPGAQGEVSQELKERGWRIYLERERDGKQLPNGIRKEDIPQDFIDRWKLENGGLFEKAGGS